MRKMLEPQVARKILGGVFTFVALANFIANMVWLYAGGVRRSWLHMIMRGGWTGFRVTTLMICVFAITGIYLLFTKEPEFPAKNKSALSEEEKKSLKKWQSRNFILLTLFWIIFMVAIFTLNYILIIFSLGFAFYASILMYSKRCPNCGYRLAYYNQLILPACCPRCEIQFK